MSTRSLINLADQSLRDQLLRNQSPSVMNPTDEWERLIAKRLIRRIELTKSD